MAYRRSSQQTFGTPQDRARADPVPEPEELTLDAAVAPRRNLRGHLLDQLADLLRDGRPSGGVRVVHLFLIRRLCQASRVPGVTIRRSRRCLGRSRARAAITARSAQSGFGRSTWRRTTATSCRSTKISTSFDASLRISITSKANRRDTGR